MAHASAVQYSALVLEAYLLKHCVLQLLSTRQSADIIVHSYPYMPVTEILLDSIAAQAGYPSRQQMEAAAPLDPLTADWEMFGEYAKLVASKQTHDYLQMCQQSGGQRWWLHRCSSSTDPHS